MSIDKRRTVGERKKTPATVIIGTGDGAATVKASRGKGTPTTSCAAVVAVEDVPAAGWAICVGEAGGVEGKEKSGVGDGESIVKNGKGGNTNLRW